MKGKMNVAKLLAPLRRERRSGPRQFLLSTSEWAGKIALGICLFAGSTASCLAGYTIKSHVETIAGINYYTWTRFWARLKSFWCS